MSNLVESLNKFSFETLQRTNTNGNDSDTVFSPYSAFSCVSMSVSLFKAQTRSEILQSLQIDQSLNDEQVFIELKKLIDGETTSRVCCSNKIWANQNLSFSDETFKPNTEILGIPIQKVTFPQPACDQINNEVKQTTKGMIEKLVEEGDLGPDSALSLLNAVYFQSDWKKHFQLLPNNDELSKFTNASGQQVNVTMMSLDKYKVPYGENEKFQIISLPYVDDYDFLVVLPKDATPQGYTQLTQLTYDELNGLVSKMRPSDVNIIMPKFTIEQKTSLNQVFNDLGIHQAFTDAAECTDPNVPYFISSILQKAKIVVDEKGTVAAAATHMMISCMCAIKEEVHEFIANHPFIYLLRHTKTGAILFNGFVKNPKA